MTDISSSSPADRAFTEDKYLNSKDYLRVYCHLIDAAERKTTTGYKDIAAIMGLPASGHHMAQQTGQMLGEISKREHNCGRPMLSVLVVQAQSGAPGPGFFDLARRLEELSVNATPREEKEFADQQRAAVFEEWAS